MVYKRLLYSGFHFGRPCGVITFLGFVIYIQSVSTSASISDAHQNATVDFTNNTTTQNDITSTNSFNQVPKSIEISKKNVGFKPFENNQKDKNEIKSGPPLALPHSIFFIDTFSQKKIEHKLSKEATEFLRWLDIDLGPANLLNRLKRWRKQNSNSARHEKIHDLLKNNVLSNPTYFEFKQADNEITRQTQEKKKMSNTHGINNSSDPQKEKLTLEVNDSAGSLDPSVSLPRFRRQVDEDEELPRWPGAPQSPLRQHLKPDVVKQKILNMMLQALYSAQERLAPMGPIVAKYEHLTPYRMAFIFLKLDQLVHESHSIFIYLNRLATDLSMTLTRRLQLYGHLVRRNVDITYLYTEQWCSGHLGGVRGAEGPFDNLMKCKEYTKRMRDAPETAPGVDYINERVPRDQATRMRQAVIRFEQEKIMKNHVLYGKTTTELLQRPHS